MNASPQEVVPPVATPSAARRPQPTHCDVCHLVLGSDAEYRPMTIVRDSTPRRLRETNGGGFIEDEWRLDAVCSGCNARFEVWLFGEVDRHESDTIPAPPEDGVELPELGAVLGVEVVPTSNAAGGVDVALLDDESAPFASVPPNRS